MGTTMPELRCIRCGWPIRDRIDDGCTLSNCSMRPMPHVRGDIAELNMRELLEENRRLREALTEVADASSACDREAERPPQSRSSAPLVRMMNAIVRAREAAC